VKRVGRRIGTSGVRVRGLFNVGGEEMYLLDADKNYCTVGVGDFYDGAGGTIYRTIKDDRIKLEGNNVSDSPTDGFRQDLTEFDPTNAEDLERIRTAPATSSAARTAAKKNT
jgi:hypothetical protein